MSKNDITGDDMRSKPTSTLYSEGWDRVFKKKNEPRKYDAHTFTDAGELVAHTKRLVSKDSRV